MSNKALLAFTQHWLSLSHGCVRLLSSHPSSQNYSSSSWQGISRDLVNVTLPQGEQATTPRDEGLTPNPQTQQHHSAQA